MTRYKLDPDAPDPFKDDGGEAGGGFIVGLAAPTGAGKTFTALRMARGAAAQALGLDHRNPADLAAIDAAIAFIDTESRRALHYKARGEQKPTIFQPGQGALFGFRHAELDAPYQPENYYKLIDAADRRGYAVIVIDSWSHEWDGEGGLVDMHADALDVALERAEERAKKHNRGSLPSWWRDDEQREKLSIGAWKNPKRENKTLVNRMLRANAHIIICMRAEDKLRIETTKEQGNNGKEYNKTTITPAKDLPPGQRWVPICEKRLPFEFTIGLVLTPEHPGQPFPMKTVQDQLKGFFDFDAPLDEATGARLALWARTGAKPGTQQPMSLGAPSPDPSPQGEGRDPRDVDDDDTFPGDRNRPPPPPAPPAGTLSYAGFTYVLDGVPELLTLPQAIDEMAEGVRLNFSQVIGTMVNRAPADKKRAWYDAQLPHLIKLRGRDPAMASKLEDFVNGIAPKREAEAPPLDDVPDQQREAGREF